MASDDNGCKIFELYGFQKFMQDHWPRLAGVSADVIRLGAVWGTFKIGDTDKKLAGFSRDGIGKNRDKISRDVNIFNSMPCRHFGPDPFKGHMQRDGRNNPVRFISAL
jgi:hypothetical protein